MIVPFAEKKSIVGIDVEIILAPLLVFPSLKKIYPMAEPWWTLPMTVAWIVWRASNSSNKPPVPLSRPDTPGVNYSTQKAQRRYQLHHDRILRALKQFLFCPRVCGKLNPTPVLVKPAKDHMYKAGATAN